MAAPAQLPRKLRVTNFERVSTDRQETERQRFDLADNCERFDLEVVETVRLKISGTKVNTKPDWQRMLDSMKSADRDGINISALDRLFRPEDFAIIGEALQVFRDEKKVIVSTKEELIEPWTPRGWEICMQAVLQAGKELAELKRRTAGGRRKAHAANHPMNTEVPYGILYRDKYNRDAEGKAQYFYEDPEPSSIGTPRREIVQMVFQWRYVEHLKTYRIVRRLNQMGILSAGKRKKDGSWQFEPGLWTRQTVIQLLQNRHYIGEHWEGGKKIDVACPQFIDREVFEAVQKSFVPSKQSHVGRQTHRRLLSEFLKCGRCKTKNMYIHDRGPIRSAYRCMHYDAKLHKKMCNMKQIACHIIERVVFAVVWKHLTTPELLLNNAKAYYDSLPSKASTANLEKELAEVTSRIDRLQEMVELGTMNKDKGNTKILEAMKRTAEIEADLRAAGSVLNLPTHRLVERACRLIAEGPMPSQFDTQRPVLEKLLDFNVFYDGEYVEITGQVPVPDAAAHRGQKCKGRIHGHYTSTLYIPFKIKERVA
jgi:DNA invertase Pin-like site-specific DNA recombinase